MSDLPFSAARLTALGLAASRQTLLLSLLLFPSWPHLHGQETINLSSDPIPLLPVVEDLFAVGTFDGADWETFSRITSLAFDDAGNLYILDGGNHRIVKVSPKGEFLAEIGRSGEGPGEFGAPRSLTLLPSGELAVFDLSKRGFSIFHPDGAFRRTVPLVQGMKALPTGAIRALPSGDVLAEGMVLTRVSAGGTQTSGNQGTRPLIRYSLQDGSSSTFFEGWRPPSEGAPHIAASPGGGRAVVYADGGERAFDPEFFFGALKDGSVAVVDSVAYAVKIIDEEGVVRRTLSRSIQPKRVTERDKDRERARRLAVLESGGGARIAVSGAGSARMIRGETASDLAERQVESLQFADEIPVVQGLSVDWNGRIWLRLAGEEVGGEGPIDLLDPEGAYLGTIPASASGVPSAFGPDGLVAFIEKDELDVPRVEVKRISLGS